MPRDDLSIDFIKTHSSNMAQADQMDAAMVLDEWTNRTANLSAEIAFMHEEMLAKDLEMQTCLSVISKEDSAIQKWIRANGSHAKNPHEEKCRKLIEHNYNQAELFQEQKIALAQKTQQLVDKHTRILDQAIERLQDKGEISIDPELPSLLRSQPKPAGRVRIDSSVAAMPLGQISNSASMLHTRQPNQYTNRALPAQAQALQSAVGSANSAPATPAASMLINRHARESSLGVGTGTKRQRAPGGLHALPTSSSNLARHSSMTPGTPRAGTPAGTRAGSAGPRISQKSTKKAPLGSRQSGVPRKSRPTKSGLSRVKRSGNKNSPSSNNDSEPSDAESGSVDDDDEAGSPQHRKDADGDEEMGDDEEGADNRLYCFCKQVSHGDMVACDNSDCAIEWFHWGCVGLKSEPTGTWICSDCTKAAEAKKTKKKDA